MIENSCIPFAVYQFLNKRVVTIAISDGFREIIGADTLEEAYYLMDNDMYRDTHPDDVAQIADAAVRFAVGGGEYNVIYRTRRGDDYIILHAQGKHIYKETGERLAVITYTNEGIYCEGNSEIVLGFNLLQEKYFQNKDAVGKISYDYLTGLPDMGYFFELAEACHEEAVKEDKNISLLFMDLSGMQAFNQRFGYGQGDQLIKAVARLLVRHFSNENCCRTTADHFAVYTDSEGLKEKLEVLLQEFKTINNGRTLPVRIGIYDLALEQTSMTTATDRAKIACDSCGNIYDSTIVWFDKKMLKRFEDRRYVFENLDRAILDEWLVVYYQPIVRTSNGRVCSEEALVRWKDPMKGLMSPADFIPILEDAKIAYRLDLYVLEQVLKKLKKQGEGGLYIVPNSINLSRTDFYACDIVEEVRKRVDASGLDRSRIIIEITENVIMDDLEFMRVQVERFRELGFEVWLDDFGSGYSSPDVLQKIHFDVVKLDKGFVDQIEESESGRIILTELVRLANGLGSETVAEGVETAGQAEFLYEIGCTRLQGYFYCRPIPLEGIIERNRKGIQIGFENPEESDYYTTIGNVNLYDMSFSSEEDKESLRNYFNTMPMFIIELGEDTVKLARGNKSYREFVEYTFPNIKNVGCIEREKLRNNFDAEFLDALLACKKEGKPVIADIRSRSNGVVHLFVRKIATNPVNGVVALAVVILGHVDNDAELKHKEELERIRQERKTYARITALSGDFICIYSVNPETDHYIQFVLDDRYKEVEMLPEGDDYFGLVRQKAMDVAYSEDREMFLAAFTKENIMKDIDQKGVFALNLRILIQDMPRFTCLKAAMIEEENGSQIIVGMIDIDEQVRKEQKYSQTLTEARNIANLDSLTGVKNKHAYVDAEMQMNSLIEESDAPEFALVVFDLNGLKEINDTLGHQAGDQFIKDGCRCICNTFQHSPVFRIGGDEFVVIAQGEDYKNIECLIETMAELNQKNKEEGKVVIAVGMAKYQKDRNVSSIFERADNRMYQNKKQLKGLLES